jgi:hypothetical protein
MLLINTYYYLINTYYLVWNISVIEIVQQRKVILNI